MIGSTVAGRYKIEAQIGIGGMGVVYRARDERLRRDVAVKVIAPHLMQQPAARARFLREAQALAGLTHPNIVTVYDLAEDADADLVLLIMELLSGQTLRQAIADETCPRSADCPPFSQVALPLCRALEAAHARDILHRDIKPENIFVCRDGTLKLMDFGLARLLGDVSKNHSSTVAGTLAYMAPEQLRGETPDARADLYALGVVFFELLTERLPFVADNPGAVLMKHLTEPAPRLRSVRPELPDALDSIVARMLEKDPAARFASAREVQAALEQTWPDDGTLALAVDRIQNAHASSTSNSEPSGVSTLNASAGLADLPTASVQADSAQAAAVTAEERPTAQPIAGKSHVSVGARRRSASRTVPLTAGLGAAAVVAALLAAGAWSHAPTRGGVPSVSSTAPHSAVTSSSPSGSSMAAPASALKASKAAASAGPSRQDMSSAPASNAQDKESKSNTAGAGVQNSATPAANSIATKSDKIVNAAPSGNASGGGGASAFTPLSNSERAELDTLRREQQEELALLHSLSRRLSDNTARPVQTQVPASRPVASGIKGNLTRSAGSAGGTRSAASGTVAGHPLPASGISTMRPAGTPPVSSANSAAASRPLKGAANGMPNNAPPVDVSTPGVSVSGVSASGTASSTAQGQAWNQTSQYEEALPHTPLALRVSRHAAHGDNRAIHVSFHNNTDCYAYFYIVDSEKRRASRAYPGPERFLAPQSPTPQDIRLPLPADIDTNRKSVLVIAAEQEITNLPPTFNLPPAPLDMPAPGADLPHMRQAIHRYNDQIGILLQQSHVQVSGKPLHPHDVLIRVTGLRPPPIAH